MRYGLLLLFLTLPLLASAEIYQWTDDNGGIHFTDTPKPGATAVDLGDEMANTSSITSSAASSADKPAAKSGTTATAEGAQSAESTAGTDSAQYTQLEIIQPQNEASFFNNGGKVDLMLDIKPALKETDKTVVLVDGKTFTATRSNNNLLSINNVERGKHTVQVQITNQAGQVLKKSNSVVFYMHQASVNSPANAARRMINTSPAN